jgi:hypothetical protein
MDLDEWSIWLKNMPEIENWTEDEEYVNGYPTRKQCLDAIEMRAFSFTQKKMEKFLAVLSVWNLHNLEDKEVELILRIILEFKNGRNSKMKLGHTGRRILRDAQKRHYVSEGYLLPFTKIVHKELE